MCVVVATKHNRALSPLERRLAFWMLQNGNADAQRFLDQLDRAEVKPVRCPCGCASIDFSVQGMPEVTSGMRVLSDFVFDDAESGELCEVFIFTRNETLGGIEVVGFATDAPKILPLPNQLRPAVSGGGR